MTTETNANTSTIDLLWSLFVNRTDRYLIAYPDSWNWSQNTLTKQVIAKHLKGDVTIAVPEMDRNSKTKFVLLDIDGPEHDTEKIDNVVIQLRKMIETGSVTLTNAVRFIHTGNGIHLVIFFQQKAPAKLLKDYFLIPLLERCGFTVDGSKWFNADVQMGEIFPRQDAITKDGFGPRLPLGKHKNGNWSKVMFGQDLESVIPIRLSKQLLDAFNSESKTREKRQSATMPDWKTPKDKVPLPGCIIQLMSRKSLHDGIHQNNLDLVQALLVSGYPIDEVHEIFSKMKGYRFAVTQYQTAYAIRQIRKGVLPPRTYRCETYTNATHGLECVAPDCPYAPTKPKRLTNGVLKSSIPDETNEKNPTKKLAIRLAKAVLEQQLELPTIEAYLTFAEAEGLIGVTKGCVGLARGFIQREHKSRADEWEGEKKGPSLATQLVEMVLGSDMQLFCDDGGKPYAWILKDGHHEIWPIESKRFKQHIGMCYRKEYGKVVNTNAIRDVVREISAEAWANGLVHKIYNRVAWHDNAIWYDLTNPKYEVIRIDENGWEILPKTPIPLFCRFDHQLPQVYPANSTDKIPEQLLARLKKLMPFHNHAKKDNEILDITSIVFSLVPDAPHPAVIVFGSAGSGKTRGFHATQRKLIDPSNMEMGVTWPSKGKEGNIPIQFQRHYNLIYSNISWISREMSDHLCRAIDGAANETRKLYSDDEMISFRYQRCIGINAIPIVATQEDLIDRALLFEMASIAAEDRLDEEELSALFEEVRPEILGAMFDTLSAAMKIHPDINLGYIERMGSFTKWGVSITQALGLPHSDFLEAYATNRSTANEEVVDADIVARVTMEFMSDRAEWEGSPKELHIELTAFEFGIGEKSRKQPKSWPKDESKMGKSFKRMKDPLKKSGLIVESSRTGRKRTMTLTWRENYGPESTQAKIDDHPEEETNGDGSDGSDSTSYLSLFQRGEEQVEGEEAKNKESPVTPVTRREVVNGDKKEGNSKSGSKSNSKKPLPLQVDDLLNYLQKKPGSHTESTIKGFLAKAGYNLKEWKETFNMAMAHKKVCKKGKTPVLYSWSDVNKISQRLQIIWKRAGVKSIDDPLLDKDRESLPKSDRGFLIAQFDKKHVTQKKAGQWVLSETVKAALKGDDP